MSKENVKKFYEALKTDKALAEELQSAVKAKKIETKEQAESVIATFAGNKGYAFTAAEFAEFDAGSRELSEEELDKVNAAWGLCLVGGGGSHGGCVIVGKTAEKGGIQCFIFGRWDDK